MNFLQNNERERTEYFKVIKVWLIPEDNDSWETHLLQLYTSLVTKEKYKIVKK